MYSLESQTIRISSLISSVKFIRISQWTKVVLLYAAVFVYNTFFENRLVLYRLRPFSKVSAYRFLLHLQRLKSMSRKKCSSSFGRLHEWGWQSLNRNRTISLLLWYQLFSHVNLKNIHKLWVSARFIVIWAFSRIGYTDTCASFSFVLSSQWTFSKECRGPLALLRKHREEVGLTCLPKGILTNTR
jgi:hypothetical protein